MWWMTCEAPGPGPRLRRAARRHGDDAVGAAGAANRPGMDVHVVRVVAARLNLNAIFSCNFLQALSSRRFQRGFDRVNLHHPTEFR